jgi:hypothetical protein
MRLASAVLILAVAVLLIAHPASAAPTKPPTGKPGDACTMDNGEHKGKSGTVSQSGQRCCVRVVETATSTELFCGHCENGCPKQATQIRRPTAQPQGQLKSTTTQPAPTQPAPKQPQTDVKTK